MNSIRLSITDQLARAGTAWRRANNTARATVAGALVLVLVGGTVLATNEDAQQVFSGATGLSVGASSVQISTDTGEPAVTGTAWFVRGQDDKLWQRTKNSAGAWTWVDMSAVTKSAPAIGASGSRLFIRGQDNALWTSQKSGGSWGPWTSLGGLVTSSPASTGSYVFVKGGDDQFYFRVLGANGTFSDYQATGGVFTSAPAVAQLGSVIHVFGRGTDNALWVRRWADGWIDNWTSLGGVLTSRPAALSFAYTVETQVAGESFKTYTISSGLVVLARGADNGMWYRDLRTDWGPWTQLGGVFTSAPAASTSDGLSAYGRGMDGKIYRRAIFPPDGTSSSWAPLP